MIMLFFRKNVLAFTGLFLCLFLLVHFAANFLLLLPESMARSMYNSYSTALRSNPLIKLISFVLLASIFFHVLYAWVVTRRNRAAKPQPYVMNEAHENSTWTSRNMGLLGVFLLVFLVVHLIQFWARIKLGIGPKVGLDAQGHVDVYDVAQHLFHNVYVVGFYALLMIPLGLHLYHGLKSAFMTLGFYHQQGLRWLARVSLVFAVVVSVGFGVIPVVVYLW